MFTITPSDPTSNEPAGVCMYTTLRKWTDAVILSIEYSSFVFIALYDVVTVTTL